MLVKRLAAENVYIGAVGVLAEMGCYVAGLNELHESVAGLVVITEMDYLGIAIGFHVNLFDQGLAEVGNVFLAANAVRLTLADVQDQMPAPGRFHFS
jgi:hypothetical protein